MKTSSFLAVRLNEYKQKDFRFSYLRAKDDAGIDLIVDRPGASTALVEIKSKQKNLLGAFTHFHGNKALVNSVSKISFHAVGFVAGEDFLALPTFLASQRRQRSRSSFR